MAKLKIQKTYTGGSGYQASATIVVDSYANNQTLTAAGAASAGGTHEGGVGGYTSQTIATIQPTVKVRGATATAGTYKEAGVLTGNNVKNTITVPVDGTYLRYNLPV